MAGYEFFVNPTAMAKEVFGLTVLRRYVDADKPAQKDGVFDFKGVEVIKKEAATGSSLLNTPTFMNVSLLGGNYKEMVNGVLTTIDFQGLDFGAATLVDFKQNKEIVKTAIAGRKGKGKVKELISFGDYEITIRGILVSPLNENVYPWFLIKDLQRLCQVPAAIKVTGRIFEVFGINSLVIEDIDCPALEGILNVQPFVLRCCSDEAIELKLKK